MKRLVAALICCASLLGTSALAAPAAEIDTTAIQALRDKIRSDKKKLVADNMELSATEAERFWPLYEAFEKAQAPIRQRLTLAMIDFIAVDSKLTDANAKRLLKDINAAERDLIKLRGEHTNKMVKQLPAAKVARFMQIEAKIDALLRFDQARTIPLAH